MRTGGLEDAWLDPALAIPLDDMKERRGKATSVDI